MTTRGENVDRVFLEMTKHDANVVQHLYAEASYSSPNTVIFWRKIVYAWLLDHDTFKFQVDDIQGKKGNPSLSLRLIYLLHPLPYILPLLKRFVVTKT